MYDRGYATEGLDNARAELLRNLKTEQHLVPEVIICEASFDVEEIMGLARFVRQHPDLKSIPFVLNCSGLEGADLTACKKLVRPDEVVYLHVCSEKDLKGKVNFLRKVKAVENKLPVPQIENEAKTDRWNPGLLAKRAFDILVASLALLILSPLLLLIAIAIRIESRGSVIYIAQRAGRGYRIFNFYKFRTMYKDADKRVLELNHLNQYNSATGDGKGPVFFKISNDPRITKVGRLLRNTSLDELPQLINVLLGDMSLVGNRPLPLYEAATLTTDDYAARFLAPAGITGLWQVKKRGNKEMSVEERISLDIDYASKCNFSTDLWIIANTPTALFQKENV
ncbi:MAG: sugar transferase [Bacteroidetes bacterium]|nr:sugar transferase [Bacteroidota bacterium]